MGGVARPLKAEPEHLVTDGEIADAVADFDDDAGQVAALAGGKGSRELLVQRAGADAGLAGIDAGGANLDEHLAGAGFGPLDIGDVEDVGPAVTIEPDRAGL